MAGVKQEGSSRWQQLFGDRAGLAKARRDMDVAAVLGHQARRPGSLAGIIGEAETGQDWVWAGE